MKCFYCIHSVVLFNISITRLICRRTLFTYYKATYKHYSTRHKENATEIGPGFPQLVRMRSVQFLLNNRLAAMGFFPTMFNGTDFVCAQQCTDVIISHQTLQKKTSQAASGKFKSKKAKQNTQSNQLKSYQLQNVPLKQLYKNTNL